MHRASQLPAPRSYTTEDTRSYQHACRTTTPTPRAPHLCNQGNTGMYATEQIPAHATEELPACVQQRRYRHACNRGATGMRAK